MHRTPFPTPSGLARQTVRSLWTGLAAVLYPPQCLGCRARTFDAEALLCPACLRRLAAPDAARLTAHLARLPAADRLDGAFALWLFDKGGTVQRLQHALKYGNRPAYGPRLGRLLGVGFRRACPTAAPDLVVPIPLHRTRLLERGYNQSAGLAEGVAEVLGVPMREDLLTRPRPTRSQTRLSRDDRWANVRNAFALATPDAVAGRRILLIDDVLTTGATLAAAAHILTDAGSTAVHAATLAFASR